MSPRSAWSNTHKHFTRVGQLMLEARAPDTICSCAGRTKLVDASIKFQRPYTQLRIRAFCPGIFAFLAVFRVVVKFRYPLEIDGTMLHDHDGIRSRDRLSLNWRDHDENRASLQTLSGTVQLRVCGCRRDVQRPVPFPLCIS